MIVHRHGQGLLGIVLSYHILVQESRYLSGSDTKGLAGGLRIRLCPLVLLKDLVSEYRMDILRHPEGTVHTDRTASALQQHLHLIGGTAAESTSVCFSLVAHRERILSTIPYATASREVIQ